MVPVTGAVPILANFVSFVIYITLVRFPDASSEFVSAQLAGNRHTFNVHTLHAWGMFLSRSSPLEVTGTSYKLLNVYFQLV